MKKNVVIYPYPRKIADNKYEIAPYMYCTENVLNDFFEQMKKMLVPKKKYCFDYMKEDVMKWSTDVRKNVTKQMLYMLPYRISFPWIEMDRIIPATDYYGEVIDDYDEWYKQRDEYIDNLYNELKNL